MNLFVGNLSQYMDERALKNIFREYGMVLSVQLVKDQATHRSSGFGYVEMDSETDAQAAIKALNNKLIQGKRMIVNKKQSKTY